MPNKKMGFSFFLRYGLCQNKVSFCLYSLVLRLLFGCSSLLKRRTTEQQAYINRIKALPNSILHLLAPFFLRCKDIFSVFFLQFDFSSYLCKINKDRIYDEHGDIQRLDKPPVAIPAGAFAIWGCSLNGIFLCSIDNIHVSATAFDEYTYKNTPLHIPQGRKQNLPSPWNNFKHIYEDVGNNIY